ncbi:MAG: putative 2OG-Fe(II) oxygenase [Pseudomonadota bacterium]
MADPQPTPLAIYQSALAALQQRRGLDRSDAANYAQLAAHLSRSGRADWAAEVLSLVDRLVVDAQLKFRLALAFRDVQQMESACRAIDEAAALSADDANIAFARAQCYYEAWRPSSALFEQANRLATANPELIRNWALALAAEGFGEEARRLLREQLAVWPTWTEGHLTLTTLLVTGGADSFDESFRQACKTHPENIDLPMAWFGVLAQARDYDLARQVLEDVQGEGRATLKYRMAEVFLQAESGSELSDDDLRGPLAQQRDPGYDLCLVRYLLRRGRPGQAAELALRHTTGASQRMFWPYLALCWRLCDADSYRWLEEDGGLITVDSVELSEPALGELRDVLRTLFVQRKPYLEQSVRGGVQTSRNLFSHPDPLIQRLRQEVTRKVMRYRERLESNASGHPLRSFCPERLHFSGAWSVQLRGGGFHSTHTHTHGWLSSALYVDVPDRATLGEAPAGYLSFGDPPPELGMNLPPVRQIEPEAGRLVLFPSYCWHGTVPFDAGERTTVAFDIAPGPGVAVDSPRA